MKLRTALLAIFLVISIIFPGNVHAQQKEPGPYFAPGNLSSGHALQTAKPPVLRSQQARAAVEALEARQSSETITDQSGASAQDDARGPIYLSTWSRMTFATLMKSWEIFISNGNESNPVQLTDNAFVDIEPRINRGSTAIVFLSDRDGTLNIYRMNLYDSDVRQLTFAEGCTVESPTWSPDGQTILFMSSCAGRWQMYRMDADGSNLRVLVYDGYQVLYPVWGPDGSQVAFLRFADGINTTADLMIMDLESETVSLIATLQGSPSDLSWSPDGRWIAYASEEAGWIRANAISPTKPYARRPIGYSQKNIWFLPYGWSPDGVMVALDRYVWDTQPDNTLTLRWISTYCTDLGFSFETFGCDEVIPGRPASSRDWATVDLLPPMSKVNDLARYSRTPFDVRWGGYDPGGAGILQTDVQYTINGGPWTLWQMTPYLTSSTFDLPVQPGDVVSFRSRAWDHGLNREDWIDAVETFTRIYNKEISGQVLDNRDQPVYNAQLDLSPQGWNPENAEPDGRYHIYTMQNGPHSVATSHAGYLSSDPVTVSLNEDLTRNFYLSPLNNQIANGGFENGLDGWQTSGELPVVPGASPYSGASSMNLGLNCEAPCPVGWEVVHNDDVSIYTMKVDNLDRSHILYVSTVGEPSPNGFYDYGLYESVRSDDGTWATDLVENCGSCNYDSIDFGIDSQGNAYAIRFSRSALYFYTRPAEGTWSAPEEVVTNQNYIPRRAKLAVSKDGWVYLLHSTNDIQFSDLCVMRRSPAGEWSSPLEIAPRHARFATVMDTDNKLHIFWEYVGSKIPYTIYHRTFDIDDGLSDPDTVYNLETSFVTLIPFALEDGRLILIWNGNGNFYTEFHPGQGWTDPVWLHYVPKGIVRAVMSPNGWIHAIDAFGTYIYRTPDGVWRTAGKVDDAKDIAVDSQNRLHLTGRRLGWRDLAWTTTIPVLYGGSASLAQEVTIPVDMKNPTFSFLYSLAGKIDIPGSRLKVRVEEDGQDPVELLNSGTQDGWKHAWFDFSPWAGKIVTLRFQLDQPEGETAALARVDDVSLGSFTTPKIISVVPTPRRRPLDGDWTIRISVENFDQPVFKLDETIYEAIQIDDSTWEFRIDQSTILARGSHSVTVVNADGAEACMPDVFHIDQNLYFPLVTGK